eukprot:235170-Chlamydomonas_euryale.AAC.3
MDALANVWGDSDVKDVVRGGGRERIKRRLQGDAAGPLAGGQRGGAAGRLGAVRGAMQRDSWQAVRGTVGGKQDG